MPLEWLHLQYCPVKDLTPLRDLLLKTLVCGGTQVTDLSPLRYCPLQGLGCPFELARDRHILRGMWSLTSINNKSAVEFWKEHDPAHADYLQWIEDTRKLPAEEQAAAVLAKLKERNPEFAKLNVGIVKEVKDGVVTNIVLHTAGLTDLSPIRGFPKLTWIDFSPINSGPGDLADVSPLRDYQLTWLNLGMTKVADLRPIRGMPLRRLFIFGTQVRDLEPLRGMPLELFHSNWNLVTDYSPLVDSPIEILHCEFKPERDAEILRKIKTLKKFNDKPVAELLGKASAFPPLDPAWLAKVQALPAAEQLKEVAAEMVRRNPEFDGKFNPVLVNNGVVEEIGFDASEVTDLFPLRGLAGLKRLICVNGDPAKRFLENKLPPAKLADLAPLKGLQLTHLDIQGTHVADLTPLQGLPVASLRIDRTAVTNLAPLTYLPLKSLWLSYQPDRDALLLRTIKTLEKINDKPASEVLK
jgi:hypothetical protein